ncbi:MAG: hypothetical protein AB7E48_00460 [Deferribacterales bacterium]
MSYTHNMTNAERLRELAKLSSTVGEFQDKAISGVMLKMTLSEFETELETMKVGDLHDYFEKVKNGDGK